MNDSQIIRMDKQGVDDVAITGDMLRMERMTDTCFWVAMYRGEERTSFMLNVVNGKIIATVQDDTLKCTDDTKGGGLLCQ